jgi:hypothetical protein
MNVHINVARKCEDKTTFRCNDCGKEFDDKDPFYIACPDCRNPEHVGEVLATAYSNFDPKNPDFDPYREKKESWLSATPGVD